MQALCRLFPLLLVPVLARAADLQDQLTSLQAEVAAIKTRERVQFYRDAQARMRASLAEIYGSPRQEGKGAEGAGSMATCESSSRSPEGSRDPVDHDRDFS